MLAQMRHALASSGQDLVWIGLVSDIPDDAVGGGIENIVQRDRQLDRTEIGRQMTAGARDRIEDVVAKLIGESGQLGSRQPAQRGRLVDRLKKGIVGLHLCHRDLL
jgi:hypothetical protein